MTTHRSTVGVACIAATLLVLAACDRSAAPPAVDVPAPSPPAASDPPPAAPAAAATPVYRELEDFVVGCDNTRACTAIGAPPTLETGFALALHRDAGSDGAASLRLVASDAFEPADLRVDGQASPIAQLPWKPDADSGQGVLALEDAASIASFVATVRDARSIAIGEAEDASTLSLSGFAAALLLIDDTQGRIGNASAWHAPGTQPVSALPRAPAPAELPPVPATPPVLTAADATKLAATVRAQQSAALKAADCDDAGNAEPDSAAALSANEAIVFLTCISGAYQASAVVFRAPRAGSGAATRLVLPNLPFDTGSKAPDAQDFDQLTEADYDPATGLLSQYVKGRGLGDCGVATRWRFDGSDFRLAAYRQLDRCAGLLSDDWPVFWRSAGVP